MPRTLALFTILLAGCGSVSAPIDDPEPDADPPAPDAGGSDPAPYLGDVLDCGTPASAGGLAAGTDLQRVDLDLDVFPEARCNDGTAAFFYFRPATVPADADRWVIQLQGGGECSTPDECAARWCSVDTNFGETQMTGQLSPAVGIRGDGVLDRDGALGRPNPVGGWNHVFVRYCSSDSWAGTSGPVEVDAHHPITGEPVRFSIAFDGAHILDAVLATLRRDGAAPPAYTLGGGATALADLDQATALLLAGGSAGGLGVISNADRIRDQLRGHAPALAMMTIVDSTFFPSLESLDFSTTTACADSGICSYQAMEEARAALWAIAPAPVLDASCVSWHAAHQPGTDWKCLDPGHVLREHLQAPVLVRQGLLDDNVAGHVIDAGFSVPGRGPMSQALFAELVAAQAGALPGSSPEEPFEVAPAVFVPPCPEHETLGDSDAVFGATLTEGGAPYRMFDVLLNQFLGQTPTVLVWQNGDPIGC